MTAKVLAAAARIIAAIVFVAAIGSSATVHVAAKPTEPYVGAIPVITDWREISLPLDAYAQSFADRQTVLRAEYTLTKNCVATFGFQFDAPAWDKSADQMPNAGQPTHYRLYGLLDEDHAQQMGYHSYGEEIASEATYADKKLPDGYLNVVTGNSGGGVYNGLSIPDGGCIGAAQREVEGTSDLSLPDELAFDAWTASNEDSRVTAAFADWSKCMATSGYQYATPMDANNDPKWSGDKASPDEISVAVADVLCKKETNLVGVRMAVNAAYERDAISANRSALDSVKLILDGQAQTAAAVLSR